MLWIFEEFASYVQFNNIKFKLKTSSFNWTAGMFKHLAYVLNPSNNASLRERSLTVLWQFYDPFHMRPTLKQYFNCLIKIIARDNSIVTKYKMNHYLTQNTL